MSSPAPQSLPAHLAGQLDVLLIDNFDSFTWNLYQYLEGQGAKVTVIRNDDITPAQLPFLRIRNLIVSPGPGHPQTDSGVSRDAIKYFAGKVPILGVCMGLQCIVDLYGGDISHAGEIVHGKTTKIRHDGRGCFKDIPQSIQSTRYHSLSAHITSLPAELAVTAMTEDSGVIMGVRHRQLTVEAVQYHPESIMSESGTSFLKNFLDLKGGTWAQNPSFGVLDTSLPAFDHKTSKVPSILEKIHVQRLKDVELAKATPGTTPEDIDRLLASHLAPPLIQVLPRIAAAPAIMTEIKRASPSKGAISLETNVAQQALAYALAGASVISVLTEPTWFKGSLFDMRLVRQVVDTLPNRPAILRKDFIIDEYQIAEARLNGADTVLLIVAILPLPRLQSLYASALAYGMEPLVEVNNAREMEIALQIGAKLIGVNNRNLHDFNVDMSTTTRLKDMIAGRDDVILCALSGITGPEDVQAYVAQGVRAVLVGEALMRAPDPGAFVRSLIGRPEPPPEPVRAPIVKVCGVRAPRDALAAAEAGADLIGVVLAPASKRRVSIAEAAAVSKALRAAYPARTEELVPGESIEGSQREWFAGQARTLEARLSIRAPLLVGVFQDQPLGEILRAVDAAGLDLVQLHGSEPLHWARFIPVPVIRAFHMPAVPALAPPPPASSPAPPAPGPVVVNGNGHAATPEVNGETERAPSVNGQASPGTPAPAPVPVEAEMPKDLQRPGLHHFVLLDALRPGALVSGGSGLQLDARAAGRAGIPVILAGGLRAENVRSAVRASGAWAVDVSGGVEVPGEFGVKNHVAVRAFVKAAKEAWIEPQVAVEA
ncbi:putative anthranilate synthase component II [Exidia glandulosa HHB12029]|uniref:Multifunctional tryptophan biosynthesis protein n=1 Tax=Exidia glandulosa HHB12029 TaxID=1314781 RepID=A0A165F4W4_EXIGL|nr:putative anthranilate synthase component II [Exidia glandulosa HHB12029]